ncbi:MAG: class I SAM-dependent methyltransferase [Salibacteraceae bacterium]
MKKEWFETWFDTRYYHLLYQHRDENEAHRFIDALLSFLTPKKHAKFLDVACGKGRHSIQINAAGFEVVGVDLSNNSIASAREHENDRLEFRVQDIRESLGDTEFDYALNLFTSFGYFDTRQEHLRALCNIYQALKDDGVFVLDYLNKKHVEQNFSEYQTLEIDGVHFEINKSIDGEHISKKIMVSDGNEEHHYEERVMAFSKSDLIGLVREAGFSISSMHGDYNLNPSTDDAPRVIIIAKK